MSTFMNKIVLSISLFALSTLSHASLITNGSFEQTAFVDNSASIGSVFNTNLLTYANKKRAWDVFYVLPGWHTTYGNGIELQKNIVTKSYDGSNHVELDSHPRGASNAVMTQTLKSLIVGVEYQLDFFYKPRTNRTNDNGINVFWYDAAVDFDFNMSTVLVSDSTRNLTPNWALQTVSFKAQAESMNLSFASFGKQNTLGGLIDNVSLKQVTAVPEPPTAIAFLIAITLIAATQYKRNKLAKRSTV